MVGKVKIEVGASDVLKLIISFWTIVEIYMKSSPEVWK